MDKILQTTSRGQVTLPKDWRDQFPTNYFKAKINGTQIIIEPLIPEKDFEQSVEDSWQEYKEGKFMSHEDLKKKYGV